MDGVPPLFLRLSRNFSNGAQALLSIHVRLALPPSGYGAARVKCPQAAARPTIGATRRSGMGLAGCFSGARSLSTPKNLRSTAAFDS